MLLCLLPLRVAEGRRCRRYCRRTLLAGLGGCHLGIAAAAPSARHRIGNILNEHPTLARARQGRCGGGDHYRSCGHRCRRRCAGTSRSSRGSPCRVPRTRGKIRLNTFRARSELVAPERESRAGEAQARGHCGDILLTGVVEQAAHCAQTCGIGRGASTLQRLDDLDEEGDDLARFRRRKPASPMGRGLGEPSVHKGEPNGIQTYDRQESAEVNRRTCARRNDVNALATSAIESARDASLAARRSSERTGSTSGPASARSANSRRTAPPNRRSMASRSKQINQVLNGGDAVSSRATRISRGW